MKQKLKRLENKLRNLPLECLLDKRYLYKDFLGPLREMTMATSLYETYACDSEYVHEATGRFTRVNLSEIADEFDAEDLENSHCSYKLFWLLFDTAMNCFEYSRYFRSGRHAQYHEISFYEKPPIEILEEITAFEFKNNLKLCCFLAMGISNDVFAAIIEEIEDRENIPVESVCEAWRESFMQAIEKLDYTKPFLDLNAVKEIWLYSILSGEFEDYDGLLTVFGIFDNWQTRNFILTAAIIELHLLSKNLVKIE